MGNGRGWKESDVEGRSRPKLTYSIYERQTYLDRESVLSVRRIHHTQKQHS
jgi:hypothetical protein